MDNFDSPVKHYDQVEEAVVVLRKTLAAAEVILGTQRWIMRIELDEP